MRPSTSSKHERDEGEQLLVARPVVPGGEVPATGPLLQWPAKGLRVEFLLVLSFLLPVGLAFM